MYAYKNKGCINQTSCEPPSFSYGEVQIKSTFKGSVDLIVQPTFKSINDTLKNVDKTMAKLNTIVDTIVEKQHQFDWVRATHS